MGYALPSNWGLYLGNGTEAGGARDMTGTTTEGWQQALNYVRQFDPNASIQGTTLPGGEGGQYLAFNNALMPQNAMGGRGIDYAINLPALANRSQYRGPTAQDSNLGQIGNSLFANSLADRGTWLDTVGPLIVGGFGGMLGGTSFLTSALQKLPQFGQFASNMLGGGQGNSISPQQLLLLRLLAARSQGGGG